MSIVVQLGPVRIEFHSRYAVYPRPGLLDPAYRVQELLRATLVYADGGLRLPRTEFHMTVPEIRRFYDCLDQARGPIGAFVSPDGLFTVECSGGEGEEQAMDRFEGDEPDCQFAVYIILRPAEQPYLELVIRMVLEWQERVDVLSSLQTAIDAAAGVTEASPDWEQSFRLEG